MARCIKGYLVLFIQRNDFIAAAEVPGRMMVRRRRLAPQQLQHISCITTGTGTRRISGRGRKQSEEKQIGDEIRRERDGDGLQCVKR